MQAQANGITLEYETFGSADAPPILLIMGLGGQLLLWPESFCKALADAGFHVIRFDNRDIGLSSRLEHHGRPSVVKASLRARLGLKVPTAYTLADMARDAIGLLDALGIEKAHVAGVSMGGMIAQIIAAEHPQRVRSVTLIMTTSGSGKLPQARLALQLRLARGPKARDRESLIAYGVQSWKLIGTHGTHATSDAELREKVSSNFDRAFYPVGMARQLTAIIASGSRTRLLGLIKAPTLVVHGTADPLIPVAAAHDLVRRIPHARLELIEGMGHDLPTPLLPHLAGLIGSHARAAS